MREWTGCMVYVRMDVRNSRLCLRSEAPSQSQVLNVNLPFTSLSFRTPAVRRVIFVVRIVAVYVDVYKQRKAHQ